MNSKNSDNTESFLHGKSNGRRGKYHINPTEIPDILPLIGPNLPGMTTIGAMQIKGRNELRSFTQSHNALCQDDDHIFKFNLYPTNVMISLER